MPLPAGIASRDVVVKVLPLRIRVAERDAVLLEGRLGGQVKAADTGDFEWELMNSANDGTRLVVTMQKWYVVDAHHVAGCRADTLLFG